MAGFYDKQVKVELTLVDKMSAGLNQAKSKLAELKTGFTNYYFMAQAGWAGVQKAMQSAQIAAQYDEQRQAAQNLANAHGAAIDQIIGDLKRATGDTISQKAALESASNALIRGADPKKMVEFMEIAKKASETTGQSVTQTFDAMIQADVSMQERMLRSVGIVINADAAYQKYAQTHGTVVERLTNTQKHEAFTQAILERGREIIQATGEDYDSTADKIDRFNATLEDLRIQAGRIVQAVGALILDVAKIVVTGIAGIVEGFAWAMAKALNVTSRILGVFAPETGAKLAAVSDQFFQFQQDVADWQNDPENPLNAGLINPMDLLTAAPLRKGGVGLGAGGETPEMPKLPKVEAQQVDANGLTEADRIAVESAKASFDYEMYYVEGEQKITEQLNADMNKRVADAMAYYEQTYETDRLLIKSEKDKQDKLDLLRKLGLVDERKIAAQEKALRDKVFQDKMAASQATIGAASEFAGNVATIMGLGEQEAAKVQIPLEIAQAAIEAARAASSVASGNYAEAGLHVVAMSSHLAAVKSLSEAAKGGASGGASASAGHGGGGGGSQSTRPNEFNQARQGGGKHKQVHIHFENVYGNVDEAWMKKNIKQVKRRQKNLDE